MTLIKILGGVGSTKHTWPVEVIKHKIHVFLFFNLQIISNFYVTVYFYFNVRVCLPRQSSWLRKIVILVVYLLNLLLISTWTSPLYSLNLPRGWVACTSKIVVALHICSISTRRISLCLLLAQIYVFKQTLLLALVVTHIKSIAANLGL